jgi:hypothetical protein
MAGLAVPTFYIAHQPGATGPSGADTFRLPYLICSLVGESLAKQKLILDPRPTSLRSLFLLLKH